MNKTRQFQLTELIQLFAERESSDLRYFDQIINILKPSVIKSILEVFEVSDEDVVWVDAETTDTVLMLTCLISPDTCNNSLVREILKTAAIDHPDQNDSEFGQAAYIGVPLDLVFGPAEKIKDFLCASLIPVAADIELDTSDDIVLLDYTRGDTTNIPLVDDNNLPVPVNGEDRMLSKEDSDIPRFDVKQLSLDQIHQILWLQHYYVGKLH